MTVELSMPATLSDGLDMAAVAGPNDFVEVDGDRKALILWTEHDDGTRSILDLYFWA